MTEILENFSLLLNTDKFQKCQMDNKKAVNLFQTYCFRWPPVGGGYSVLKVRVRVARQTGIFRNHNKIILIALQELKYHAHLYLLIHNLNEKLFALLMIYTEFFSLQKRQN